MEDEFLTRLINEDEDLEDTWGGVDDDDNDDTDDNTDEDTDDDTDEDIDDDSVGDDNVAGDEDEE